MTALLLASLLAASAPPSDAAWRAALWLVYDGETETALRRLEELSSSAPDDPLGPALQALALCWKIEERLQSTALDGELHRLADRAVALADFRLRADPRDTRALMARGEAHAVRSRLLMDRRKSRDAARSAVRMREDLMRLRELEPDNKEVLFGLGLYDYYADVLPRLMRLVRLLAGIPGGDRKRGLLEIDRARAAFFHATEVQAQLYEIYAFYEAEPDKAYAEIRDLRRRFPGSPLWSLKLAEHQRDRLGLYAESADVAREILAEAQKGHRNYASPVLTALAQLSLGESLLLDLRLAEARQVLLEVRDGVADEPTIGGRARLLLGRSLEMEGDRDGALVHYRLAAGSADRLTRRRAQAAISSPMDPGRVKAMQLLAEARRLRESGRPTEAAEACRRVLGLWPGSQEAALRVAEDDLEHGRLGSARARLSDLLGDDTPEPPWVRPWIWLLVGHLHDLAGDRRAAVLEYKKVWERPWGREELRDRAAAGLQRAYTLGPVRPGGA